MRDIDLIKNRARTVYNILIELCGAPSEDYDRECFVRAIMDGCKEYRCCPKLGFGGKFYIDSFSVAYYQEHKTPKRDKIQNTTNERLASLLRFFTGRSWMDKE